jgi:hypothetical protein
LFSGIRETQCGDPLAHGQEGVLHRARAHRLAGLGGKAPADAEAKHEEVGQPGFGQGDITEGWLLAMVMAESGPQGKDRGTGLPGFGDECTVSDLQRKAEISVEAIIGCRCCCCQGHGSG